MALCMSVLLCVFLYLCVLVGCTLKFLSDPTVHPPMGSVPNDIKGDRRGGEHQCLCDKIIMMIRFIDKSKNAVKFMVIRIIEIY